ncbi:FixH family protein [Dyadobacter bucti]|uniref:FixH family protein n=1 Tax=Dyadobacter bucti TaxID=2572203 RepID=UPI001E5E9089|nr:FixH family protein [Dyadobacter bucti]
MKNTIKINWGTGIAILYTGFVAMILVLVVMSTNQKIDLATDRYYDEELKFQDRINKTERAEALSKPLSWTVTREGLLIQYPEFGTDADITGKITLYCPSNNKNDRSFPVAASDGKQFIAASDIPQGRYRLQIDWKNSNQTFWNEGVILISHGNQ